MQLFTDALRTDAGSGRILSAPRIVLEPPGFAVFWPKEG